MVLRTNYSPSGEPSGGRLTTAIHPIDMIEHSATINAHETAIALLGGSGVVSMGLFNVKAYGAIGNGSADDTAAIQAAINAAQVGGFNGGGIVYFPPGDYALGSTLLVKESHITLMGAGIGATILHIDPATAAYPAITVTGYQNGVAATPTNNMTYASNISVRDLMIDKATPVVNSTPAISLFCTQFTRLYNVHIRGFGVAILASASWDIFAYQVVIQSNSAATISTLYGWKFDGTYGNVSSYLSHCTVGFGGEDTTTVTSYAYYNTGAHVSDWFLHHCEAGGATYGFYWSGSTAASGNDVLDIHFIECIADQCQYGFTILDSLTPSLAGGQVDIDSCYWANRFTSVTPTPNNIGVNISNSSGVSIRGFQAISGNPGDPTHYQNNYGISIGGGSRDISIIGLNLKGNAVQGIFLNGVSYTTIAGSNILQTLPHNGNGIYITGGCSKLSITGNTIRCLASLSPTMANGIRVENTSTGIALTGNVIDTATVTTPLSVQAGSTTSNSNNIGF